jgi:hypothetical protein
MINYVGYLPRLNRAEILIFPEGLGDIDGCRLNGLHRTKPGFHEHFHFFMDPDSRYPPTRIGSSPDQSSGLNKPTHKVFDLFVTYFDSFQLVRRELFVFVIMAQLYHSWEIDLGAEVC